MGEFTSPGTSAGLSVASASGASGKSDGEDDAGADDPQDANYTAHDQTDGFHGERPHTSELLVLTN